MFSPFPLLRLPRLVLSEVFKLLSIGDKIMLSLCSKRISTQINNDRLYSQKVILDLHDFDGKIVVHFENDRDTFEIFISPETERTFRSNARQYSIAGCTVRVTKTRNGIRTLWKNYQDQKEGFRSVIRHLSNMFQCKIPTGSNCCDIVLFETRVSLLFDLQVEFESLCVRFTGSKDENLLFNQLSSGFRLVEDLCISSTPDPGFIPVFSSWPQEISIWSSAWFTLEHLLESTCTRITLWISLLKNKDLDEILKNWKAGRLPNLKHLSIDSLNITNNGEHILGMNLRELDGMAIQTDDGLKKATIERRTHDISMFVTPLE
ncbi:hypothetical protein GCK72_002994 [Caenorhabditis remanei]|uniref:F-box domain-containing protein n=1 Tax=Caenorhabditis remanei TaxID=31234 RepID=A0A6A5HTB2_CAERE|nr:hypothetical protein GCK72_002994 [Caenorhabditis remanei]KAF1771168.1 hypothetical protein GCK72_002994 [Caenorhabditis remanei]